MKEISLSDQDVTRTLDLLRKASTETEYLELGVLLRNPLVQEKLKTCNRSVLKGYDLVTRIVEADERWPFEQRNMIARLLGQDKEQQAVDMIIEYRSRISMTDSVEGRPFLEHVLEKNKNGYFVKCYYHSEIVRLLEAGQERQAWSVFLAHEDIIGINDKVKDKDKSLYQHALKKNPNGIFVQYYNCQHVVSLIGKGQDGTALKYIQTNKMSVSDEYKGRALWEHAVAHKPESLVFRHAYESDDFLQTLPLVGKLDAFLTSLRPELFFKRRDTKPTLFARSIDAKVYDVANHIILKTKKPGEQQKLCEVLQSQSQRASGETYLATLRKERPASKYEATQRASLLSTMNQLDKYEPNPSSRRAQTYPSFREIVRMFDHQPNYDDTAFIGLILTNMQSIASAYHWLSPGRGMLAGSKLYSICSGAIQDLGVDLKKITQEQKNVYVNALEAWSKLNPRSLTLLSEAGITVPKRGPLIREEKAQASLTVRATPEGSKQERDPAILPTSTGYYKLNPKPIGTGGWGIVYSAQHYSRVDGPVIVSQPCAIKKMFSSAILDKEHKLFQQAYPDQHFELFTKDSLAYLAMPLFAGVPLDEYLLSPGSIPLETRQKMAMELLTDLSIIHSHGVTHHDIKPKNILFDPTQQKMHILDFGCAEKVGEGIKYKDINTAKYAIEYMPPEYVSDATPTATPENDIYSMTLSLAEILGINKRDLVQARMERALYPIDDIEFKQTIKKTFEKMQILDEVMFSQEAGEYRDSTVFNQSVTNYVQGQYDFTDFQDQLGPVTFTLLNDMQSKDPKARPSAEACLERLREGRFHAFKASFTTIVGPSEGGSLVPGKGGV